jgi:hypothetical protein
VSSRERKEEKKETQRCKGARTQRRKEVGGWERIAIKIAVKIAVKIAGRMQVGCR